MPPSAPAGAGSGAWRKTAIRWRRGSCRSSKIPHELDRYIAASQVGITLSSLILGAYGQSRIAPRLAPFFESVAGLDPETALSTAAASCCSC